MAKIPSVERTTPDLEEYIQGMIDADLLELNTCMPARVVRYDSSTQTCTVQPAFKRTTVDGIVSNRAEIDDVPVMFPRSGSSGVSYPVTAGETVLLVFSQRSLDDWIDKGGEVELSDFRVHDVNDAIAITGLFPLSEKMNPAPKEATELRGDKIFIGDPNQSTTASGAYGSNPGIATGTPGNIVTSELDLISIVETLINVVNGSVYGIPGTGGGGLGADSKAILDSLLTDLQKLKV